MGFSDFVGHEDARLALILNAIDPRCGGVLFAGEKGSGKTTLARLFQRLLPEGTPFVTLPLNVTEDALLGTIDVEATIRTGERVVQAGLFSRAHGGILFIDDVNLLATESVSLVLEVNGRRVNLLEREGISEQYNSEFMLVATMDPQEGFLSAHFLDRFGMCVFWEGLREKAERILIVKKALAGRFDLDAFLGPSDEALRNRIRNSRNFLGKVTVPDGVADYIAQTCVENAVSGHRAELFLYYTTKALAAYSGDKKATINHVDAVVPLVSCAPQTAGAAAEEEESQHRDSEDQEKDKQSESKDTADQDRSQSAKLSQSENDKAHRDERDNFDPSASP